jgi:hypothetical protein
MVFSVALDRSYRGGFFIASAIAIVRMHTVFTRVIGFAGLLTDAAKAFGVGGE